MTLLNTTRNPAPGSTFKDFQAEGNALPRPISKSTPLRGLMIHLLMINDLRGPIRRINSTPTPTKKSNILLCRIDLILLGGFAQLMEQIRSCLIQLRFTLSTQEPTLLKPLKHCPSVNIPPISSHHTLIINKVKRCLFHPSHAKNSPGEILVA